MFYIKKNNLMISILEPLLKINMFNYVPIKHKQMSFMSNGGKFKLYTVLNGLFSQRVLSPGFHLNARYLH
jgi:hypothetical protein